MIGEMLAIFALAVATPSEATTTTAPAAPTQPSGRPVSTGIRKPPLGQQELSEKRKGWYVTGVPFLNRDPDKGIGYGARLYIYDNGEEDDEYFAYSPYFHRIYLQYFQTTDGFKSHAVKWDAPYLGQTKYRVRAAIAYERDTAANYFGVGSSTLEPLTSPRTPDGAENFASYESSNRDVVDGRTFARYNRVDVLRPRFNLYVERDVLGGLVRPQIGIQFARAYVNDYSGSQVEVDGQTAINAATKLKQDAEAGQVVGFDGGWDNPLKLAIAFDTRDFEPDPNRGLLYDITLEFARPWTGSDHSFNRYATALRHFISLWPSETDLVFAYRAFYQVQTGDVPFYEMSSMGFSHGNDIGLGGLRTLRGYPELRFVGKVMALTNAELRWTFFRHKVWGQDLGYMLSPFVDAGRVFDKASETSLRGWRSTFGGGARAIWNQATIVSLDYGVSRLGGAFYANFGLIF